MNIDQLKYFIAVAETQHLSSAAEIINISEPALSKSISRLEDELGYALFDRVGRNIRLSRNGELFLPYARASVKAVQDGLSEIIAKSKMDSNIVTIQSIPLILFPGLLDRLFSVSPDISFIASTSVASHELEENLLTHRSDICISSRIIQNPAIDSTLLTKEQVLFVASEKHPLAGEQSVLTEKLLDEEFLMTLRFSSLTRDYNLLFPGKAKQPPTTIISNINETLEYISIERGVAAISETIFRDLMKRQTKGIVSIPVLDENGSPVCFDQIMYTRRKHNTANVKVLMQVLQDFFDKYNNSVSLS